MTDTQPTTLNTVITMQYPLANNQGVVIRKATTEGISSGRALE